jgi:branched-subunit amino acid transport protein
MTMLWVVIVAVAIANAVIKAAGPVLVGGRNLPAQVTVVTALLAPAILTGLIVTQLLGDDGRIVLDERVFGVGVAAIALTLRAHMLVAVVLAVLTVAALRQLG